MSHSYDYLTGLAAQTASRLMKGQPDTQIGSNLNWAAIHVAAASAVEHLVTGARPGDVDQQAFRVLGISHPDVFETMVVGLTALDMPLYEITDAELVPFRRLHGGTDLYEREIEDLLWNSMEEMTGETLFPIARKASWPSGASPT